MARGAKPGDIIVALQREELAPFYLFYGPGEFRLEKTLDRIREGFIPESFRELNVQIFYGDKKTDPDEIIQCARSFPFMARNRLVIVRRVESFPAGQLEKFLPYLENPSESTCLIFISSKTNFNQKFYKRIRASGRAVNFTELREKEVVPWIKETAKALGLRIDHAACQYLHQIAGNRLRDLSGELEKLYLRHGADPVGVEEVRELAIHSRLYNIFELMNAISMRNCGESLQVLTRYLEEEGGRDAPLRVLGMLNRQIRLLWEAKTILSSGGGVKEVSEKLRLPRFFAKDFLDQSKQWSEGDLEKGLALLYRADGLLKASARPKPVLESLILSLCV